MSVTFQNKIARAIRQVTDEVIPIVGQKAIFYRYVSEYDDTTSSDQQDRIDELYDKTDIGSTDNVFDDPFETEVFVDWPEDMEITRNGEIRTDPDEDVPIEGKFKFDDYPTINSYFKIPFNLVDYSKAPANPDKPESEKNLIIRLEINRFLTKGVDNQVTLDAQLGVKRSGDNLHPDDNSLEDHVPDDFFQNDFSA